MSIEKRLQLLDAAEQKMNGVDRNARRKRDTRRVILVGQMMMERAARNPGIEKALIRRLDDYLTREADRRLFGLPVE